MCKFAAPVRKERRSIKRSWLIDTGCPFDLAVASDLQEDDFIVDNNDGLVFATANGPVEVDKVVQLQIGLLLEHIEALVLESTPLVLNVGNRCKLQGTVSIGTLFPTNHISIFRMAKVSSSSVKKAVVLPRWRRSYW